MKKNMMLQLTLLICICNIVACASLKERAEERHLNTKTSLLKVIDLVKKGNTPAAQAFFYENANCNEGPGCYEYIFKGENRIFRASDSYGFELLTNHIQIVSNCKKSKNIKDLEKCVQSQPEGTYTKFILSQENSNSEETRFDPKAFCEIGLGGIRSDPKHNDLFRAIKWTDFSEVDSNLCEEM